MTATFTVDPQQFPVSAPQQNSPLVSFDSQINALKQECEKLKLHVDEVINNAFDIEPLISAASQLVLKINHLLSIFLQDFYFPLKWSRLHREKERTELLEHVEKWHKEFKECVFYLLEYPFQPQVQEMLNAVKSSLLYNSMVTNAQPPRTVKRGTNLDTSVRCLYNNQLQNGTGNGNRNRSGNCQISLFRIFMLNEAEALTLFQNWEAGNLHPYSSPPSILLSLDDTRNILSSSRKAARRNDEPDSINAAFPGLKVDSEEKNSMDILERKFCLLYLKTIVIDGVAMETWCVSLPFVLMSNSNQTCAAYATIFWDNYFKKEGNWLPFQVKEETNWKDLSLALIDYFKSETKTEWNLTPKNLEYIGKKIFKTDRFHDNSVVKKTEFCTAEEKPLANWRWLFSIVKLIKKHLTPFWNSGAIVGFIDRLEAENLIRSKDPGTFLVRFADSLAGGVSYTSAVAPTKFEQERGFKSGAQSVQPMSDPHDVGLMDLRLLSLDQRLMTSPKFTHVLYFEPSLNYQEVLRPKGEKFTRPSEPEAEKETNRSGTGGKNSYEKPIVIVVDDPASFQMQPQAAVKSEPGTEIANGQRRDENCSHFVSSTSHTHSQSQSPNFTGEWANQNQNQYPFQLQYQYQYPNKTENENEWRPQDFLFNNVIMYENDVITDWESPQLPHSVFTL